MGIVTLAGRAAEPTVPVAGLLLKTVAEGSVLKLNEDGSPVEFYVAKHDYEPSFNGGGRTLLVRKELASKQAFDTSDNAYAEGPMDEWLNDEYRKRFDAAARTAMGETFFYYTTKGGTNGSLGLLKRAVFLPSAVEVGATVEERINPEGEVLPIRDLLREPAYLNGDAEAWWTRSPLADGSTKAWYVSDDGSKLYGVGADSSRASRPCFTLPCTSVFDRETLVFREVL